MKGFKTISEWGILYEARQNILNKMIEALKVLQEADEEDQRGFYDDFKLQAERYEELTSGLRS